MTAVELTTTAPARREVRVPLTRLTGVKGRKQLDTRAGRWLLITIGVVTAIVLVVLLFVNGGKHSFRELLLATVSPQALLLPIVGILAVTSEVAPGRPGHVHARTPARARGRRENHQRCSSL
jgi:ABC-2 type transport system permease protein